MPQSPSRLTARLESLRPAASTEKPGDKTAKPKGAREVRSAARKEAILAAALEEFSTSGFAAARLEDVAKRAGVAKGTIYLYFADKEALFQDLAREMLQPLVAHVENFATIDLPFPALADSMIEVMTHELLGTRRQDIIRLILTEGPRFPALAEFYYREVLSKIFAAIGQVLQRAVDRGELRHKALIEFPQLLAAPMLVAIMWNSVFGAISPLDAKAMLKAHVDILLNRGAA